ncbi:AAA family ATPase, partial [bacterium]|nr:AAA family ATPase [bacterium]
MFDFKPGLNVVRGPNESGKSTLRAALMAVLFGNPTSSSETIQDWTSWGKSERCELKLEYTDHAGRVCRLRKDFAARKIFLLENEETFRTFKTIQTKIAEELGISTEDFYSLCSSLDVRSLSDLGTVASRKQIGKILSSLMTGAVSGQDVLQVLKRLEDALRELGKGQRSPSKVPGPIKATQDRLTQLSAERAETRRTLALRKERLHELAELNRVLEKEVSHLADLDHLIEVNLKLAEADRNKVLMIEQDTRFEQTVELRKRIETELEELNQKL